MADQKLMDGVASGREGAVEELYDRFGSLVYRMAVQALPTRPEAEDAVQEIFVRLWKTSDRYDSDRAALVTWVMLLTRRHLVDKLRRGKSRISAVSLEAAASLDPGESDANPLALDQRERFGTLMERISALPELQRTVVTRAYLGGQTLRQIGDELETPLGTVKSALSRALVRLRERAGEETL
ncbi:MAG: sigma-70 family RNA polymerase sigma factor [Planctomycetota bacterium]